MTRIISGSAGGRTLRTPPGSMTRPTSDRVREALFSRLEHHGLLADTHVLDLYAGSGALGLEAASRGAARVLLVESDRKAAKVIARNIDTVGAAGVRVVTDTVERVLRAGPPAGIRMDLVFIDPPYDIGEEALTEVLGALVEHGWLAPEAFDRRGAVDEVAPAVVACGARALRREALRRDRPSGSRSRPPPAGSRRLAP